MDNVVHPSMRKWISSEFHLGPHMKSVIDSSLGLRIVKKFDEREAQRQIMLPRDDQQGSSQPTIDAISKIVDKMINPRKKKKKKKKNQGEDEDADLSDENPEDGDLSEEDPQDEDVDLTVATLQAEDKDLSEENAMKLTVMTRQIETEHPGFSGCHSNAFLDDEDNWNLDRDHETLMDTDEDEDDDDELIYDESCFINPDRRGIRDVFNIPLKTFFNGGFMDSEGVDPVAGEDMDPTDTLDKWMQMGVKSGPHRLLSGEQADKKFASFMDRAFAVKTGRELQFAEVFKENHMADLGIDENQFKKLQEECSPALGADRGESFKDDPVIQGQDMPVLIPPIPDADKIELKTLAVLLTSTNPTGPIWRSNNVQQQIDDNLKHAAKGKKFQNRLQDYADGQPGLVDNSKDFLIEVSLFSGRNPDEALPADVKLYAEPKLVYKLHLLGTNTVAELRAALHCENELVATAEVKSPADFICREEILKNKLPTWALVLGNKVFGDGPVDIATAMADWINKEPQKNLGPFVKGDNQTMLKDLTVRFGYPYVYIHIGKCEHIIVINQARMICDTDEYRIEKYPVMPNIPHLKNTFCRVDNEHMATWSVADCFQFPENPMLICTTCLRTFCYNHDGSKRIPFRLFPFRQLANEI